MKAKLALIWLSVCSLAAQTPTPKPSANSREIFLSAVLTTSTLKNVTIIRLLTYKLR